MTPEQEIKLLRDALKPFVEAYELASTLCKSRTLGDWEALAKHHTEGGAYMQATMALRGSASS